MPRHRLMWMLFAATMSLLFVASISGGCTLSRNGELPQQCTSAAECILPNACYVAECTSVGQCVFTPTDNSGVLEQTANDCALWECVIDGETAEPQRLPADDDRPADVECVTRYSCNAGELVEAGVGPGTICGAMDQGTCQDGACVVGCDHEGDPSCDDGNVCTNDVCNLTTNECEYEALDNVDAPAQVDGDCRVVLCQLGVQTEIYDDADIYDDGSECTVDTCNQGQPVNTPEPLGTSCTGDDPLASVCDAFGACVQCNADAECIGFMAGWTDTDCQTPQCVAGACELTCEPLGVVASNQSPSPDCQTTVCDGACGYQDNVDDSDVPDDGFDCTQDFCDLGNIMHPPEPINTPCGAGGLCDGNGNCGACNLDSDCQADTFCRDWSCNLAVDPRVCVSVDLNEGLDLPTQSDGDCHTLRCNMGVIEDQIDDSDLPVDNLECTDDVCTAGVDTNPPLMIDTVCTEGGGRFCDGNGACVDCNSTTQCSLADGICEQDLCSANTCVIDFFPDTTNAPASCQTNPNCQVVRCDGFGNCGASVPDDADVVDDGNECTADSCSLGAEVHDPVPLEGLNCTQNGVFCDGAETCQSGVCATDVANPPCPGTNAGPDCNDSCNEAMMDCSLPDAGTTSCDDGSYCNGVDTCDGAGTCVSTGNPCPGHDVGPNCNDSCDETNDNCNGPDAGATTCTDDNLFCTGAEVCDGAGSCVSSGNPCAGHNVGPACNDSCDETNDNCTAPDNATISCLDDGSFCTGAEACDGAGSCVSAGNPCPGHDVGPACNDSCDEVGDNCNGPDAGTTTCDDGAFCNGAETCDGAGSCVSPGNPCAGHDVGPACNDSCDEGADDCNGPDAGSTSCTDDNLFCTGAEVCDGAGSCVSEGNPCSGHDVGPACNDSCDETDDDCMGPDAGTTSCDDGAYCNGADTCDGAGTCASAGNPCAGQDVGPACNDSCNETDDDCTAPDAAMTSCLDDGLFCTGAETCDGSGSCLSGGDPCDGPDGDAMCAETCDDVADDCMGNDPNGSDCGGGNVCLIGVCADVRLVFVTSTVHVPSFGSAANADAVCAARATAGGLSGTFMAWTSDAASSPSGRFNQSAVPYLLLNGTQVAADWASLVDGAIDAPINVDEFGAAVGTESVWTGTADDGTASGTDCLDWVSVDSGESADHGRTNQMSSNWTQQGTSTCDGSLRLYCFEQ